MGFLTFLDKLLNAGSDTFDASHPTGELENLRTSTTNINSLDRNDIDGFEKIYADSPDYSLDKHFAANALIDIYYRKRNEGDEWLEKCLNLCQSDIENLDKLQLAYAKEQAAYENERMQMLGSAYKPNYSNDTTVFQGRIPAFKRLAISYEKLNRIDDAIAICDNAITYYRRYGIVDSDDFESRKSKLEAKKLKLKQS